MQQPREMFVSSIGNRNLPLLHENNHDVDLYLVAPSNFPSSPTSLCLFPLSILNNSS